MPGPARTSSAPPRPNPLDQTARISRPPTVLVLSAALMLTAVAILVACSSSARERADDDAPTGSASVLTIGIGTVAAGLYPSSSATVTTTASNPTAATEHIASLELDTTRGSNGFAITGDTPAGGCSPSSFSLTPQKGEWTIDSHGTITISLPNAITLATDAEQACQGVTVGVYLVAHER
jgi:hypothetical protein